MKRELFWKCETARNCLRDASAYRHAARMSAIYGEPRSEHYFKSVMRHDAMAAVRAARRYLQAYENTIQANQGGCS